MIFLKNNAKNYNYFLLSFVLNTLIKYLKINLEVLNLLIAKILQKISRIIYFLTPQEFIKKDSSNFGIIKLLNDEKDKEVFEILSKEIKNSVPFVDDDRSIRKYAIELALSNKEIKNFESLYYLEFGVYTGRSSNFFSEYVSTLYAFDSFEGLKEDWSGMESKGTYSLNKKIPKLNSNVTPIVGWVEDTLENFLEKHNPKINFVHMDLDLYKSTKFTLEKIKPYLVSNAVILFDELYNYLNWTEGEYKALQEVFSKEEYKYKAFRLNGCQAVIQIEKKGS